MQIRRFLFTLFALVALSPFLAAQAKVSGTIPSTGGGASCVSINVDAQATVAVQVTGTWTGTLQPKLSIQGQTAANIRHGRIGNCKRLSQFEHGFGGLGIRRRCHLSASGAVGQRRRAVLCFFEWHLGLVFSAGSWWKDGRLSAEHFHQ
jgi:hypothetical protein